jgi:hypothetical protein
MNATALVKEVLLLPLYAAYGLWLVVRLAVRLVCGLLKTRELFRAELKCPTCGAPNSIHDRWACNDCGAEYLGAVHTCGICRAGASWFPCVACRAAIPVRLR